MYTYPEHPNPRQPGRGPAVTQSQPNPHHHAPALILILNRILETLNTSYPDAYHAVCELVRKEQQKQHHAATSSDPQH